MRLIDADALEPDTEYDDGEFWAVSMVQIDNAPTVEQEQKKKGKWIDDCTCSNCYWTHEDENGFALLTHYNFCPNCGADMREGERNES